MKILLADDHSMIRNGLKLLIQSRLGGTEVSEVGSCHALMEELTKKKDFTHLVLDLNLSDGNTLEVIPKIRSIFPDLKIMVFSMQPAEVVGPALRQYNILYVLSKAAREDQTLTHFLEFLYDKEPARFSNSKYSINPFSELAVREVQILNFLLRGNSTAEIAETLNLKRNTISTLKKRIFEKTKTANFAELKQLAELYKMPG